MEKIDTLIVTELGYKNKKMIVELKKRYGMEFEENLLTYLRTYRINLTKND